MLTTKPAYRRSIINDFLGCNIPITANAKDLVV